MSARFWSAGASAARHRFGTPRSGESLRCWPLGSAVAGLTAFAGALQRTCTVVADVLGLLAGEPEVVHEAGGLARVCLTQAGRAGDRAALPGGGADAAGRAGQFVCAEGFVPAASRKRWGIHHR